MGSWVLKFCGSTKFQFRNCGSTKFQFRKLWIHKKNNYWNFCGNTTFQFTNLWVHKILKSHLCFHKVAILVISTLCHSRPSLEIIACVGWEGFRVANATNLIQLLNWMRFVCVMLCRDFCKHWNGGLSWTGEYHPVTQLDELRLCDVLQRSLDCGGLQVSVDNSVYMTASRVPRTSFAHGGAWRLNDHRGCAGRCEGMWKLIGSTIIQSLLPHMWVYTRDLAWAATWSQCQNSTCAATFRQLSRFRYRHSAARMGPIKGWNVGHRSMHTFALSWTL